MADEEKTGVETDDWLDDLQDAEPEAVESEDVDQGGIDDLLGDIGEGEDQGDASAEEASEELDQSDIDSLLGGSDQDEEQQEAETSAEEEAPQEEAVEDSDELDQSDIDSLLGGDDELSLEAAPDEEKEEPKEAELDQSNIDDLFGSEDVEQPEEVVVEGAEHFPQEEVFEEAQEPSQEDMDQLFDGAAEDPGEAEEPHAETVSFSEVLEEGEGEAAEESGGAGDESFGIEPDDSGFAAEDFDFEGDLDDIPEIPDEATISTEEEDAVAEDIFAEETGEGDFSDLLEEEEIEKGILKKLPFSFPAINKAVIAGLGACLVLVIGVLFFVFRGKEEPPAIILPEEGQQTAGEVIVEPEQPRPLANAVPVVADAELEMAEDGGAVAVLLSGQDEDNDPLDFVVTTPPQYGRLSGDMPNLTYLPNNDFPGEDRFEFRASDGKDVSFPASVLITGPDFSKKAVAEKPKVVKPKRPVVLAKNVTLKTKSTDDLVINWQKIWGKANHSPFNKKIAVEIMDKSLQGQLIRTSRYKHLYRPDKFWGGHEIIKYRFSQEGVRSKERKLLIKVELGSPAPEINLQPLAEVYAVGETVVLDASPSRDEARDSLTFDWRQVGGVPIQMETVNEEGSAVAFVAPSSFQTDAKYPGPVILLTATDQTGKTDTREITIITKSRRQAALWRGRREGGVQHEPHCPQGNCPGALLPWPYAD